jgi:LysR family glycine cleavage system transcriptional activator
VSRQISTLEEYLGVQLFVRERIGVRLTEVGEAYAQRIGPVFEQISEATEFITQKYSDNVIRLRTYTTLTARWLIPKLGSFKTQHPDIEVVINNSSGPLDFSAEKCDMAILFGDGHWLDADATLLLDDIIEPVCAPGFLGISNNRGVSVFLWARRLNNFYPLAWVNRSPNMTAN